MLMKKNKLTKAANTLTSLLENWLFYEEKTQDKAIAVLKQVFSMGGVPISIVDQCLHG